MLRILKSLIRFSLGKLGYTIEKARYPGDFLRDEIEIIESVQSYSLLSRERLHALIGATKYILRNNIPGDIVVCGVWKGGSALAVIKTLLSFGAQDRRLYLYDTYEGMTKPSEHDYHKDIIASVKYEKYRQPDNSSLWHNASIEEVKRVVLDSGYPEDRVIFVKGKVEETIPKVAPDEISIMHLDTDWYKSTTHELKHLFPRAVKGGIILVDDYGHWAGQRKAVDEYLESNRLKVFLNRIDYTGRIIIKH